MGLALCLAAGGSGFFRVRLASKEGPVSGAPSGPSCYKCDGTVVGTCSCGQFYCSEHGGWPSPWYGFGDVSRTRLCNACYALQRRGCLVALVAVLIAAVLAIGLILYLAFH
jgi:hypothetical protein